MTDQNFESKESKLLRENWASIHSQISGSIVNLSIKATSANLLTKEEQEKCTHQSLIDSEQANRFMQYISNRVSYKPENLEIFINKILSLDGAFTRLARELCKYFMRIYV